MKIILNRGEVKSLRRLANSIEQIEGMPVDRATELVDKTISTKAYMLSMVTGQLTIELKEEVVLECLAITNSLVTESSPILKAVYSLGQALAPTFEKYGKRYSEFFAKYRECPSVPTANWEVQSVTTETVNEREVC